VEREDGLTASGEAYNGEALAAAHPNMQLPSLALVRNAENGKEVIVRVNDRPRKAGAIEFTPAAARALGMSGACTASLTVSRLGAAPYAAKGKQLTPQPPREPTPRSLPSSGAYLVQIGAFAQRDNAESAREQVAAAGPVSVEPAIVGGASLFRVRLGPWATREEAEQARAAAAGLGFPGAKLLLP
jgi:rare lipoprotein A